MLTLSRSFLSSQSVFYTLHNLPMTAKRCYSINEVAQEKIANFPLHSAVEEGNIEKVVRILKTEIIPVNSKNDTGEWPLYIAAKKWQQNKDYPLKILRILQEYGACYMYDSDTKEAAQHFVADTNHRYWEKEDQEMWGIRIESIRQSIEGCGFSIHGCTNGCLNETKVYSAEEKAKIAYESLSTELSLRDLATKHGVKSWEIVKWRRQARESLISLFDDKKP